MCGGFLLSPRCIIIEAEEWWYNVVIVWPVRRQGYGYNTGKKCAHDVNIKELRHRKEDNKLRYNNTT